MLKSAALLMSFAGCAVAQDTELDLPSRAPRALTGREVLPLIANLSVSAREALIFEELAAGNVPQFLRRFVSVRRRRADALGVLHDIDYEVAPDVLAIGSDSDFFRVPLTPTLGQRIADRLGCVLPTRRMVDDIWAVAPLQLSPVTFSPSQFNIVSPALFFQHHLRIEQQRAGQAAGLLVAGIKKDVVITPRLVGLRNRVAIYGWHRQTGVRIQPLYTGHVDSYVDYSHGIRLVRQRMLVDGQPTTVGAVLTDPVLHPLLSDEGVFAALRYPTPQTAAAETFPLIDAFPAAGPALRSWRPKFTAPTVLTMPTPSRDGVALAVRDPAGGTDSIRLGHASTRDQVVQADLYCEHRPGLAATAGYERVGVFARDRAAGAFDGTQSQQGACYALVWDSGDGRLSCLRVAGGVSTDLLPQPVFAPTTAWRRMRIEARGDRIAFFVDGDALLSVVDGTHRQGEFGIGHHEFFADNRLARGARADSWFADVPQGFRLRFESPLPGQLRVDLARGVPRDAYFTAMTLSPGAYPGGWFFGLDPSLAGLAAQLGSGQPAFVGLLDAAGRARTALDGLPGGVDLYAVSLDLYRLLPPVAVTAPVQAVTR